MRQVTSSFTTTKYPDGLQDASLLLLPCLYGLLDMLGEEKPALVFIQATLLHLTEGQQLYGEVDVLQQSAQLLHFLLDIMF